MRRSALLLPVVLISAAAGYFAGSHHGATALAAPADAPKAVALDSQRQVEQLQEQLKRMEGLVPDQAAVMTHVAYHFTNVYVAVQKENWPLADFYLGETMNNIKWAVRTKPIRKNPQGQDIDLAGIAQSIENTQFKELQQAIAARDKGRAEKAYEVTLAACYACHTASGKPYLKPHTPTEAEVRIINFEPEASTSRH
ncbi:MAG: hypothetical protein JWL69_2993 [Phycisphaerales bacterium]|nr:hypothetical protein [Phycisphaerales bacterium]